MSRQNTSNNSYKDVCNKYQRNTILFYSYNKDFPIVLAPRKTSLLPVPSVSALHQHWYKLSKVISRVHKLSKSETKINVKKKKANESY